MAAAGAGAGAGANRWQVPVDSRAPEEGTITYLQEESELKKAKGFFSFSYYSHNKLLGQQGRDKGASEGASIYIWGMYLYTKLLEEPAFCGWKILIYTDQYTYEKLSAVPADSRDYSQIQELKRNLNVIFAIINWDRHSRVEKKINGGVLRTFRARAPFDFPDKSIFIRDADTFFEKMVGRLKQPPQYFGGINEFLAYLKMVIKEIKEWEVGYLTTIQEIQTRLGKPLLIVGTGSNLIVGFKGSSTNKTLYKQKYHDNEVTGIELPFGIFAGLVSVLPGVPIYQDMNVWNECVDYLNTRSVKGNLITKANNTYHQFSDNDRIESIGRDEQMYLYILMRLSKDNLFIYDIDLGDLTVPTPESIDIRFHEFNLARYKKALGLSGGRRKTYRRKRPHRQTRKH